MLLRTLKTYGDSLLLTNMGDNGELGRTKDPKTSGVKIATVPASQHEVLAAPSAPTNFEYIQIGDYKKASNGAFAEISMPCVFKKVNISSISHLNLFPYTQIHKFSYKVPRFDFGRRSLPPHSAPCIAGPITASSPTENIGTSPLTFSPEFAVPAVTMVTMSTATHEHRFVCILNPA